MKIAEQTNVLFLIAMIYVIKYTFRRIWVDFEKNFQKIYDEIIT